MKKLLITLAVALTLLFTFVISIGAVQIGELSYTLTQGETESENTATLNSHKGKTFTDTDIVIPEYVEYDGVKYYVTALSSTLFESTNITTVKIESEKITVIPEHSFKYCANLTSVEMPDSIKKICGNSFQGSPNLKLNPILPASLEEITGSYSFQSCSALESYLVFPEGFTSLTADTGLQTTPVKTLIFKGEMTSVRLQYFGSVNVYFLKNSVDDMNGNFVATQLIDGVPYYTSVPAEKIDGNNYTAVTGKTLTITAFSNNGNNSGSGGKTDTNGDTINPVNFSQDRLYFCAEGKMCYLVRNSSTNGSWTSYFAPFDVDATKASQNRAPHYKGQATLEEDSCYATYNCMCCNAFISKELSADALGHENGEVVSLTYENGFLSNGKIKYSCSKCALELAEKSCDAMFTSKGYSQDSTSLAIVLDINVNTDIVSIYEKLNNKEIIYGVVGSYALDSLEQSPMNADGTAKSGAVSARFDSTPYTFLQLKLTNISDKDQALHCCGYIAVDGEITYINGSSASNTAIKVSYNNYTGIPEEDTTTEE